mmetsp:Transcript_33595/g.94415  ORF Transcript_33595/g.94415 Transcript_33595/m.94415 type:complete len:224 (+) Transcript_33595:1723-2394(+)
MRRGTPCATCWRCTRAYPRRCWAVTWRPGRGTITARCTRAAPTRASSGPICGTCTWPRRPGRGCCCCTRPTGPRPCSRMPTRWGCPPTACPAARRTCPACPRGRGRGATRPARRAAGGAGSQGAGWTEQRRCLFPPHNLPPACARHPSVYACPLYMADVPGRACQRRFGFSVLPFELATPLFLLLLCVPPPLPPPPSSSCSSLPIWLLGGVRCSAPRARFIPQ